MSDPASNHRTLAGVQSGVGIALGAASGGLVTVTVWGITVQMLAARDVSFAAGDPVSFVRSGQTWTAVARTGTTAITPPLIPNDPGIDPNPPTVSGSRTFLPVETRTRQGTVWLTDTDDVYQGQYGTAANSTGCAFYGNGPRALAGATVDSATIQVRRRTRGGPAGVQATSLRLVTETFRPTGAPTLGFSDVGPALGLGEAMEFDVETAWAQAMVDGTAGGLAVFDADGVPYVILEGLSRYGASFALTINYTR